ncbi:MAG: hypothetical protein IJE43_23765, partial [Alphaproteobacteria bacterium]|nr:hypothetical protein [Alphaproteobacteria bacterium]
LLPSLLKTNVCFYHIYLFKLREAKVEETEIIDNIESWRRLPEQRRRIRKHSLSSLRKFIPTTCIPISMTQMKE